MSKFVPRYLTMPLATLLIAIGIFVLIDQIFDISSVEEIVLFTSIFAVLLTVKNHFSQIRFIASAQQYLDGISDFQSDISKRLLSVSTQIEDTDLLIDLSSRMDQLEQQLNLTKRALLSVSHKQAPPTANSSMIDSFKQIRPATEKFPLAPDILPITIKANKLTLSAKKPSQTLATKMSLQTKLPAAKPLPGILGNSQLDTPTDLEKHLKEGKLQMYLQPALTLPGREVTHYEAFARLDAGNENIIKCSDFLAAAEASGTIAEIDNQMLFKIFRILREMRVNKLEPGIFWNLSRSSLTSKKRFDEVCAILKVNFAYCPQILVEVSQETYLSLNQSQLRKLSSLRKFGVRLSIEQCTDITSLKHQIQKGVFSFIKVPAPSLVGHSGENHPLIGDEVAHLAAKHNVALLATHVEEEYQVMALLEKNITMGQGNLFSEPRPTKYHGQSTIYHKGSLASH